MRGGTEARAALLDVAAQGGEVDRDRTSGIEKDTEFYRGDLIDDQSDVTEGRTGQTQPRQSANPFARSRLVAMR
jgi:hypothetical protein